MHSTPRTAWLRLVLLPVCVLLLGFAPGRWHCADGRPCEAATVAACCCGCTEEQGNPRHVCETEPARAALSEGGCGCYRQALSLDVASAKPAGPNLSVLPLGSRIAWEVPEPEPVFYRAVPAAAHSPPRYLCAPSPPRAPPAV